MDNIVTMLLYQTTYFVDDSKNLGRVWLRTTTRRPTEKKKSFLRSAR